MEIQNTSLEQMLLLLRPLGIYTLEEESLVYCELASYAKGFALVYDRLALLYREAFLPTAESFGLDYLEQLMGFPANNKLDLERRRELLRYTISLAAGDYDLEGMKNGLRSIGLDAEIEEDRENERLYITANAFLGNFISYDRLKRDAQKILPAHLEVIFEFGNFTWDAFDAKDKTFDQLDARDFSWDEFEIIGESLWEEGEEETWQVP